MKYQCNKTCKLRRKNQNSINVLQCYSRFSSFAKLCHSGLIEMPLTNQRFCFNESYRYVETILPPLRVPNNSDRELQEI